MNADEARKAIDLLCGAYRCPQCKLVLSSEEADRIQDQDHKVFHTDCPKGGTVEMAFATIWPDRDQTRDALETVVSLTQLRPEGSKVMTAGEARKLLREVGFCPAGGSVEISIEEYTGTLHSVIHLFEALRHVLPYCYEPADQTVACPECGEAWWMQNTDLDGNWHAPGCKLFQARLMTGDSKDVRDPEDKVPAPVDVNLNPARVLRDQVLSAWFQRLARMAYSEKEPVPEGMDKATWQKAVYEVLHRLQVHMDTAPKSGPYAGATP
jgi:hypothetical protein